MDRAARRADTSHSALPRGTNGKNCGAQGSGDKARACTGVARGEVPCDAVWVARLRANISLGDIDPRLTPPSQTHRDPIGQQPESRWAEHGRQEEALGSSSVRRPVSAEGKRRAPPRRTTRRPKNKRGIADAEKERRVSFRGNEQRPAANRLGGHK
ncbi:hypothetical protein SKAU_G00133260 [Synaphobranchus kaupii]|uniref:Uncharacterized protein n=1 Tax=Synaphobranchus kaupii TaxID=118154 RepID=A0A9Q1FQT8_SYNKA|nr:hypothetical protein SKAU_G00133260 [Synaphobranchus kaupii]